MNKKKFIRTLKGAAIAVTALTMISCENVIIEEPQETETTTTATGTVEVNCSYSQVITDVTRTRAANEEEVEVEATTLSDIATHIYYVLMKDGKVYQTETQVYQAAQTDDNATTFGTIDLNVEEGDYTLVIFANNESNAVTISDNGLVSMNSNRVTDSFSFSEKITVSSHQCTSVDAQLKRCITQVEFVSTDKFPSNIVKMKYTISNTATQYDLVNLTGCTTGSISRSIKVTSTSTLIKDGKYDGTISLYIAGEETTVNATLEFYDSSDNLLYSRQLNNITVERNRKTIATAALFTKTGMEVPMITITSTWGSDITQSF
jgi:hypothetical protein